MFKALSPMTNHIQHKRVGKFKCVLKMWGVAICRREILSMGDSNRSIIGRLPYTLWNVRGGGNRGFGDRASVAL